MGIAERREREKEKRRNDIINAAETVIFTKGYDTATMDDVAEQAELSKGTLYLYFKSKHELYHAIIYRGMEILAELFNEVAVTSENGLYKSMMIGKAFIKFSNEYPNYFDAFLYHGHNVADIEFETNTEYNTYQVKKDILKTFISIIEEGINDGTIDPALDPRRTAVLLWGELMGVLMLIRYKGEILEKYLDVNREELMEYFFDFTRRSLGA